MDKEQINQLLAEIDSKINKIYFSKEESEKRFREITGPDTDTFNFNQVMTFTTLESREYTQRFIQELLFRLYDDSL